MSLTLSRHVCAVGVVCLICADGAPMRVNAAAQARNKGQGAPVQRVAQASELTVTGFVLRNDRKTRVPDVKVRMRNVTTGAVVGTTVSDRNGAFSFQAPEPGPYVIEAVKDDGNVQAVSAQFMLTDTMVSKDVILPGPLGVAAIFASSLFVVLAAGTASGVIPVIPPGRGPRPGQNQVTSPER